MISLGLYKTTRENLQIARDMSFKTENMNSNLAPVAVIGYARLKGT